ncbi:MAG: bifunctional YncE family protein/alkaline phosphatase family protein [Planctomycetia bacterium]|nr:bifunctional YncE family protein/alkaline phosphatase family protein [Planctomycetia bacterium]
MGERAVIASRCRRVCVAVGTIFTIVLAALSAAAAQQTAAPPKDANVKGYDQSRVGDAIGGRIVVPTNQVLSPLGRQVAYEGRPNDLALSPDGRWLGVLGIQQVLIVDPIAGRIVSRVAHEAGSYAGIVFTPDGRRLLASSFTGRIGVFDVADDGALRARPSIKLAATKEDLEKVLPIGLAIDRSGKSLWAVLNLHNTVAEIGLADGVIRREIPVGNAPYGVLALPDKLYVTNWAGRMPDADSVTGPAGRGPQVRVDPKRYIASDGSVSVVDLKSGREAKQIVVGLHPSAVIATPDLSHVIVANANSDTVSVIDTARDEVVETISTRPAKDLVFGSSPTALATSADGKTLYVANATNNAVAVIALAPPGSRLLGSFPTGWYPAALVLDHARDALYVANMKGIGSRSVQWKGERRVNDKSVYGYHSKDYLGTVSLVPLSDVGELAGHTRNVLENNRLTETISALAPPREYAPPRPVPQRHGEPSPIKHVLYIIKENRTYDQVLGDVERGEGSADLCIFGRRVTPNHHKLVDEFVLLDNFYCSGVLSADGHQWATEAYVVDYIERGFGGWPRSYPYAGGDAMAYAASGFLWDNALAHKKTVRNYGEFVRGSVRWKDPARQGRPGFMDCYRDFHEQGGRVEIRGAATIKSLEPFTCPTTIGFPSIVSDIYRADQFKRELARFEADGNLPNLMIMLLPNDHTSGTRPRMPTPEASVADNDLALGQVVEALSHSRFWPTSAIFVVEDDPQAGFDHIDGHRTVAMVISPYARRRAVDSTNYNQTSMIRTMELILGLAPMNQLDASATAMASCFTDKPDLAPYKAVKNNIPLDRLNPDEEAIRDRRQLHWAKVSLAMPLDEVDEADEDTLNRVLWHSVRGRDDTYPAWAVAENDDDD